MASVVNGIALERPVKVYFLFSSKGIGGAEKSMLRLIKAAHPHTMQCAVILTGAKNQVIEEALRALAVPCIYVKGYRQFIHYCQQQPPDVIYLFGRLRTIPWAIAARFLHVSAVIAAERSSAGEWIDRVSRTIDQFFVDGYICNSRVASQAINRYVTATKRPISVIYNGIDCTNSTSDGADKTHSTAAPLKIVCVANLHPRKGHLVLLQSIKNLQTVYPGLKVTLIGSDFTNGEFVEQCKSLGLSDTFEWLGYVSDVVSHLQAFDIFVLPSIDREGTPTSILEAMHAGLAVVASDIGGSRELIQNGQTGLLVQPGNVSSLENSLRQLLQTPSLRLTLGKQAQAYVTANHTIQNMVAQHLQTFQELINRE